MKYIKSKPLLIYPIIASGLLAGCEQASNNNDTPTTSVKSEQKTIDVFATENEIISFVDFESPLNKKWFKTEKAQTSFQTAQDNTKLKLSFSKQANYSKFRIKPEQTWDLTEYEQYNFAFDVNNISDDSVHFYLSLENPEGGAQRRSVSLPAGYKGTVYFPLDGIEAETETGLWGDAPPWPTKDKLMVWRSWRADDIKLEQIAAMEFFTIGILENKSILIDNIRLRKNPETDPNWMKNIVDRYGQNAKMDYPLKINSDSELRQASEKELAELADSNGMPNRSKFGGYTQGPKLEATGYFRTQKVDGKWWLVDPQGYLFFSHGPANVRMANMSTITGVDFKDDSVRHRSADEVTPEDSMGIVHVSDKVRETRYITSSLRHDMFEWLPDYDDPLANHYSYRRSTHKGAVPHGETYSFYQANLERKYGEQAPGSYLKKWHDVTVQRMQDWGFTSFGNWVDPAFYDMEKVPYFANGWIIGDFKTLSGEKNHWGLMPDPFDPVFAERAQKTIDVIAKKVKASPWCAGIFIDNEKSWGEREGSVPARYGVILDALSKSAEQSPAKNAFSAQLQTQYQDIDALNQAWQTSIKDWNSLKAGIQFDHYPDALVRDLSSLLEMLGEQYFTVVHNTLEKALPHHLYMGARMANWGMPDEIIKASIKYSDVLSFNIYEEGMQPHFWSFLEEVDLPVVIGEFHIGTATDSGLFNPGIVHASDQKNRAKMYKNYMQSVLNKPYMVGAHWFQYVDEPISGRAFDGENANIGFVTVTDRPYPELVSAVKEVTSTMYQKRLAKSND
ncbi:agarase [Catenovulum adriaticum]|uniref:Agarase n=1 Tax=Catenovulum adriaticum TaxID=2984846 RepID=A0ABY7ASK4_9ALTE|nr:agarase [Catenovulum sp. TS8]WAJ72248.1 agarase [Catenovulum sp. TS8]